MTLHLVTARLALLAALAGAGVLAHAQAGAPVFTAPPGALMTQPQPGEPARFVRDPRELAQSAIELYRDTCASAMGNFTGAVDAALNLGLQPYRPSDPHAVDTLLGGAPGDVYAMPETAELLQLAVTSDGRCTVWVHQADGPKVRAGFVAVVDAMKARGASVSPTRERFVDVGGVTRQQTGFSVRAASTPPGSATTMVFEAVTQSVARPGTQALTVAAPATAAR